MRLHNLYIVSKLVMVIIAISNDIVVFGKNVDIIELHGKIENRRKKIEDEEKYKSQTRSFVTIRDLSYNILN